MSSYSHTEGTFRLKKSPAAEEAAKAFKKWVKEFWGEGGWVSIDCDRPGRIFVSFEMEGEACGSDMVAIRNHLEEMAKFLPRGTFVKSTWDGCFDIPEGTVCHERYGPPPIPRKKKKEKVAC